MLLNNYHLKLWSHNEKEITRSKLKMAISYYI